MKIEAGKFYRTREGSRVGPMEAYECGSFSFKVQGEDHFSARTSDGRFYAYDKPSGGDLVSEWSDEASTQPDWSTLPKSLDPRPEPVTKASLLDAAKAAVADRGLNYGKPEDNFDRIARLWQSHLTNTYGPGPYSFLLSASDVAIMMVLMKVARLENDPKHLDSWTDLAGYAACGAEITNG